MSRIIGLLLLLTGAGAAQAAGGISIASELYVEQASGAGHSAVRRIAPAASLSSGDRIVTVLRWGKPAGADMLATSRIPAGLSLQSVSLGSVLVSSDGGRRWLRLPDGRSVPRGITHIRWSLGASEGQLTYRAIVR